MGCSVSICSDVVHHGLQGDNHHCHSPLHGLQGNSCSGAWSTSSFLTDLDVCRVVSLTVFFPLTAAAWHFPVFIKYIIFEVQQVLLIVSALAHGGSLLEPAETGSIQQDRQLWCLLTEATPAAFPPCSLLRAPNPLPKSYHENPICHQATEISHGLVCPVIVSASFCKCFQNRYKKLIGSKNTSVWGGEHYGFHLLKYKVLCMCCFLMNRTAHMHYFSQIFPTLKSEL